ncbi:MAG TPA: PAS domain-containing sensor histidine kinase [Candidatus Saccharimonadales bacterium]|nr:PAS domain-containing sensor histidine kinase [Candidatus Saccharimonadales bacterium]
MDNATTEAYRQYVKENLERLNAIFEKAAVGDFSQNIAMPAEDDAFIGLYKGTQILLDVIQEKIKNLETEISNKNQIQEGLYNQEQELRALVENSPDIIARFDKELRHVYVNPTIARITGIPVRSFLGKTNAELGMPEKDLLRWNESIRNIFETGKQKHFEFTITSPDGIIHHFQARLVPERSRDKSIKYVLGVSQEITEIKKRTAEFDRLKDEFISLASHELRTPMTAIKGFISMIMAGDYGPVNEPLKRPLYNISTSTERQIYLINDLLDVSRIQARRLIYYIGNFSLKQILQEVISSLQSIAKQKKLRLNLQIKEDLNIQGDADKVKQILNNLIGNALKFTLKGNIQVSYITKEDLVLISIIDTGIGITSENIEKLFGKFQQINETNMAKPPGTGLGLFLSRELARGMGGDLWLEQSEQGKGSTFIFSIPKANTQLAKKVQQQITEQFKAKEKNIL